MNPCSDLLFPRSARVRTVGALALAMGTGTPAATAQWTVVNLSPAGSTTSQAFAVSGGQQVGMAYVGGIQRAALWSGSPGSWVDLNPAGAPFSIVYGVGGGQQVGYAGVGGDAHASLWSGTAASWVDLSPPGSNVSVAYGASGGKQAGQASYHAGMWSGTAASWLDLNPAGSTQSEAFGLSNGKQVGYAVVGGVTRASLWQGTAASWVDLNPAGAAYSYALGVSGGQQVGYASVGGVLRASLWTGTAASWIDLSPPGSPQSSASETSGGQQVGFVVVAGASRASLWSGTAASRVDLNAFLPADFTSSEALGIWNDAATTYVAGWGVRNNNGPYEAILWTSTAPGCCRPTGECVLLRPADCAAVGGVPGPADSTCSTLCCVAASVSGQPQSALACPSGAAAFSVTITGGSGQVTYNWQLQTSPGIWTTLGNDPGPISCPGGGGGGSGSAFASPPNSSTVSIGVHNCPGLQHWQIRAVVTDACGSATSNPATLTVCPADFNCSNSVTVQDIFDFLAKWFSGAFPAADFNGDSHITVQDIFDLLAAWFAHCS